MEPSALARKAYPSNNYLGSEVIGPPVDVNWSPKQRPRALSMPRPRTADKKKTQIHGYSMGGGLDIEL